MKTLLEKANYLKMLKSEAEDITFLWERYIIENTTTKSQDKNALSELEKAMVIRGDNIASIKSLDEYYVERLNGTIRLHNFIKNVLDDEKKGSKWFSLNNETIKDMHRVIFIRDTEYKVMIAGKYRFYQVSVNDNEKIDYELITDEMNKLLSFYHNSKDDLFTKLANFHIIFEDKIHPFLDGNGRVGRAIINLELARNGFPMIGLTYPSPQRYYNVFEENLSDQKLRDLIIEMLEIKIDKETKILELEKK